MTPSHGRFVWYELMTTDGAAAAFYGEVVGWRARAAGIRDVESTLLATARVTLPE